MFAKGVGSCLNKWIARSKELPRCGFCWQQESHLLALRNRFMSPDQQSTAALNKAEWFTATHWSVVLMAGHDSSPQAAEALERLCRTYWYPLYAYVRRQGHAPHDAQD